MNIRIYGATIVLCTIVSDHTLAAERYAFLVSKPLKTLTVPVLVGTAPIPESKPLERLCLKLIGTTQTDQERNKSLKEFSLFTDAINTSGIATFSTHKGESIIPNGRYYPLLVVFNERRADYTIPLQQAGVKGDGFTVPPLVTVKLQLRISKGLPIYEDATLFITGETIPGYKYNIRANPAPDGYECEWTLAVPNHQYFFEVASPNDSLPSQTKTAFVSLEAAGTGIVKLEEFAAKK